MEKQPALTVSSLDIQRLERLLASEAYRDLPGVDALESELHRANVVDPADMPPGVVTMNSTVRFIDDASGARHEVTLVYPGAGGSPDKVSVLAPVGMALLGLSVGQSIAWQVPDGRKLQLRILEVVSQPEAKGELHR